MVHKLKYKACTEFVDRIKGSWNFSDKWIVEADSVRLSNVRNHAQHLRAMPLLRKRFAELAVLDVVSTTPIGMALNNLSDEERVKLRVVAYFVACENLPFTKYSKIYELKTHHGVDVSQSYIRMKTQGKKWSTKLLTRKGMSYQPRWLDGQG